MSTQPADRRRRQESSEYSLAMQDAPRRNLTLEEALKDEVEKNEGTNEQLFERWMSFRSVISTTSTNAEMQQAAVDQDPNFPEIGIGSVGQVFAHPGTPICYKLPKTKGENLQKLHNNYLMQVKVSEAFQNLAKKYPDLTHETVLIPRPHYWAVSTDDAFWDDRVDKFEWNEIEKGRTEVLCMERIFPVPEPFRHLLIERFCPPAQQAAARDSPKNKQCLVRIILGRESHSKSTLGFNLRNYSMTVDKFAGTTLLAGEYALAMAGAMATLHWEAQLDGNDIEFVLGSVPTQDQEIRQTMTYDEVKSLRAQTSTFQLVTQSRANFKKRLMCLWMLDFDMCQDIGRNDAGVEQAVKAFMDTYAYCPRPHPDEFRQGLWQSFGTEYIRVSRAILPKDLHDLPAKFLTKVEERIKANREAGVQTPSATPQTP
ncbi:hypothetical protein EJ03DRAFT_350429 [Teratosphaeria nubilosa]|uniref:DUF3669 domain-containing protein n=1 Tax=Teratosphaeria nubilosa TaxID=161662 RepID=A0A6G1LCN1_9PEZI|nr:hypothetical protein EJ03DRAFT_350429 [Teratosphaeria nubilosa]